jgi:mRNA-degrading endonuclease RelE of RelBE toxin-antitoxin system
MPVEENGVLAGVRGCFSSGRVERLSEKQLPKIPKEYREAIGPLGAIPLPEGKRSKKLTGHIIVSQFTAQYRLRIGPYRLLYDIDDQRRRVDLLKLAKRDEQTYS